MALAFLGIFRFEHIAAEEVHRRFSFASTSNRLWVCSRERLSDGAPHTVKATWML